MKINHIRFVYIKKEISEEKSKFLSIKHNSIQDINTHKMGEKENIKEIEKEYEFHKKYVFFIHA